MKYPNNIKKDYKKKFNAANRGMSLEYDLNITNEYFKENDIALIYKKPTPIKVVNVEFDSMKNATITKAYFEKPSTTDYNGIYKGKYIDFEAKEVKSKSYFCLTNIHKHQLDHLFKVNEKGGISFIIVRFDNSNKTFILFSEKLKEFINTNKRKSIPIEYFCEYGHLIGENYNILINYIETIDKVYFGGNINEEN
jgi:recombination protein U